MVNVIVMIDRRRLIEISDVIEAIAQRPQDNMVLYTVVLTDGVPGHTIGECFTTRDDVIAYLFDKDISLWQLTGYDANFRGGEDGVQYVDIRLYRNLK